MTDSLSLSPAFSAKALRERERESWKLLDVLTMKDKGLADVGKSANLSCSLKRRLQYYFFLYFYMFYFA